MHRLEPLAARRFRALGRDVPEEAAESERLGAAFALRRSARAVRNAFAPRSKHERG